MHLRVGIVAMFFFIPLVQGAVPERNKWEQEAYELGCEKDQETINLCSEYDYQVLDAELNDRFKLLLNRLQDPKSKNALVAAERAWLKFIKADCLYENGPRESGGTSWPHDQNICMSEHVQLRIEQLGSFIKCTDNGCPE